jgi:hypothetical protein
MPACPHPQRQPTDDWDQLRLLVGSPEQEPYELLRPIVLFGQPIPRRAREAGVPERTLRRQIARFDALGMRSLFADLVEDRREDQRRLPAEIRQAIVALKTEYPAFGLREIAAVCQERFDRPVSHQMVSQVLTTEPLPLDPPRRFPRYHEGAGPVARRRAVVKLYERQLTMSRMKLRGRGVPRLRGRSAWRPRSFASAQEVRGRSGR